MKNVMYPAPSAAGETPATAAPSASEPEGSPATQGMNCAENPPVSAERAAASTMRPLWEATSLPSSAYSEENSAYWVAVKQTVVRVNMKSHIAISATHVPILLTAS